MLFCLLFSRYSGNQLKAKQTDRVLLIIDLTKTNVALILFLTFMYFYFFYFLSFNRMIR